MFGGVVYGLTAGLLLQCVVVGVVVGATSQRPSLPVPSRGRRIISWLAAEVVVIPLSLVMTTAAYAAPVLLTSMVRAISLTGDGGAVVGTETGLLAVRSGDVSPLVETTRRADALGCMSHA